MQLDRFLEGDGAVHRPHAGAHLFHCGHEKRFRSGRRRLRMRISGRRNDRMFLGNRRVVHLIRDIVILKTHRPEKTMNHRRLSILHSDPIIGAIAFVGDFVRRDEANVQ